MTQERVGVVGAGSIGAAFCVLFAKAGYRVGLTDPEPGALERARADIASRLQLLARHGLLPTSPEELANRIDYDERLSEAVRGSLLVQECAPERVGLKRELFARLAEATRTTTVLASSSSAIVASRLVEDASVASRVLVGHPGNPPYLLPVIEIVPSPLTSDDTVVRAEAIYRRAGLRPVRVHKEIEGFVFNRLQGAVLREAYRLVRDGVASVDDVDAVVRLGLGRRWGVVGPFETVDLNTRGGIESHAETMGAAYERMGAERGEHDTWTDSLVKEVTRQRRTLLPIEQWNRRVEWRDDQLAAIVAAEEPRA